jgi:E1A-binding protein p400
MISEHTVEENILRKAQQKRHLDFLVMGEGKFNMEFFSKNSLRELVGDGEGNTEPKEGEEEVEEAEEVAEEEMSAAQLEAAMAQVEDKDDVVAMKGAQAEAANENDEFSDGFRPTSQLSGNVASGTEGGSGRDSATPRPGSAMSGTGEDDDDADEQEEDEDGDGGEKKAKAAAEKKKRRKDELAPLQLARKKAKQEAAARVVKEKEEAAREEEEMNKLRANAVSAEALEAQLQPIERYAVRFRETKDPMTLVIWGVAAPPEVEDEEIALEEIEKQKEDEEMNQIADGELLASMQAPLEDEGDHGVDFRDTRVRMKRETKRRKLTGEAWETRVDGRSGHPFYYNVDTGEAQWDKPALLQTREALQRTRVEVGANARWLVDLLLVAHYPAPATCSYTSADTSYTYSAPFLVCVRRGTLHCRSIFCSI